MVCRYVGMPVTRMTCAQVRNSMTFKLISFLKYLSVEKYIYFTCSNWQVESRLGHMKGNFISTTHSIFEAGHIGVYMFW